MPDPKTGMKPTAKSTFHRNHVLIYKLPYPLLHPKALRKGEEDFPLVR